MPILSQIHTGIRAVRTIKEQDPNSISEIFTQTELVLVDGLRLVQQWTKDYNQNIVSVYGQTTNQIYQIALNPADDIKEGDLIYLTLADIGLRKLYTAFEIVNNVTKPLEGSIELTVRKVNVGQLIKHKQVIAVSSN